MSTHLPPARLSGWSWRTPIFHSLPAVERCSCSAKRPSGQGPGLRRQAVTPLQATGDGRPAGGGGPRIRGRPCSPGAGSPLWRVVLDRNPLALRVQQQPTATTQPLELGHSSGHKLPAGPGGRRRCSHVLYDGHGGVLDVRHCCDLRAVRAPDQRGGWRAAAGGVLWGLFNAVVKQEAMRMGWAGRGAQLSDSLHSWRGKAAPTRGQALVLSLDPQLCIQVRFSTLLSCLGVPFVSQLTDRPASLADKGLGSSGAAAEE